MKLTLYTDYSLRVLIYLASTPDSEKLVQIKDIATAYGISKNHLMKVTFHLGKLGYVETIRGRNGGLSLAVEPSEINIGNLIRATEEDFNVVECFSEHGNCIISQSCSLKAVLHQALQAFLSVLDQYTLEDLVKNNQSIRSLLFSNMIETEKEDSTE